MAVTVTETVMLLYDTGYAITSNAATSTVADATEAFTIQPSNADNDVVVIISNPTAAQGSITYSVAAGDFWGAGQALTGTVENATKDAIVLKGAKYKDEDGKIVITFTPASGKKLLTDHAMTVEVIELP